MKMYCTFYFVIKESKVYVNLCQSVPLMLASQWCRTTVAAWRVVLWITPVSHLTGCLVLEQWRLVVDRQQFVGITWKYLHHHQHCDSTNLPVCYIHNMKNTRGTTITNILLQNKKICFRTATFHADGLTKWQKIGLFGIHKSSYYGIRYSFCQQCVEPFQSA